MATSRKAASSSSASDEKKKPNYYQKFLNEYSKEWPSILSNEVCGCNKGAYFALKERVEESKQRITLMESEFLQSTLYTENELDECREELRLLKQQYNALEKSHQELHEVNTDLEERILDIAAAYEKEKQALNREVLTLSQKLLDTKFEINKMEEKNNRYKKDCELAVQLLQCTPSGAYMQHKVSALPHELQYYVHQIMGEIQGGTAMKRSSTFGGVGSGGPPNGSGGISNSASTPDSNQPLLNSGGQSSNGFLASRVYCNVPANIIAQAMQRRDEDEKKEMERMMPLARHRSKESSTRASSIRVALQDKSTQTIALGRNGSKGDLLCVRCGADLDLDADNPPVVDLIGGPGVASVMNLLDLSEPILPPPPPPAGPSNSSLLLDLLGGPLEDTTESVDNVSLTDLIMDGPPLMDSKSSGAGSDSLSSPQKQPTPAGSVSSLDAISDVSSSTSKESKPATPSNAASLLPEAEAAAAAQQNNLFARVNMAARRNRSVGSQRNNNNDNDYDELSDTSEEQRTLPTNNQMTSDPVMNDSYSGLNSEGESTPTSTHSMEDLTPISSSKNSANHISSKVDNRKQVNGSITQENDNEKSNNLPRVQSNHTERREMKGLNNTERKGLINNPDRRDQVRKPGKASQQTPPKGGPAHLYLQTSV